MAHAELFCSETSRDQRRHDRGGLLVDKIRAPKQALRLIPTERHYRKKAAPFSAPVRGSDALSTG
jgi:hypothetical protein